MFFGKYNYKTMSRPKPTVLLQHSNKTTYKMDEVLAAEGIWAVFYDGKPINLKSSSLVANCLTPSGRSGPEKTERMRMTSF